VAGMLNVLHLHKQKHNTSSLLQNMNSPENIYILGLLWADGSCSKYNITLSISIPDTEEITPIIQKTGEWNLDYRKGRFRNNKKFKDSIEYRLQNKDIITNFRHYLFNLKSTTAPLKLLKQIPKNLLHYFYLGLFDGDGNFYHSIEGYHHQFSITSTINQDWNISTQIDCNFKSINLGTGRLIMSPGGRLRLYDSNVVAKSVQLNTIGDLIYLFTRSFLRLS
jgi:hypothetical protein